MQSNDSSASPAAPGDGKGAGAQSVEAGNSAELAAKRGDYYSNWDKVASEQESSIEQEEKAEVEEAAKKLGLDKDEPRSEAEKRDREKREALKAAKRQWDNKKQSEKAMRAEISEDNVEKSVTEDMLQGRRVLCFKGATGSTFKLPSTLNPKVVKIFVEECQNCTFELETITITSHVEVTNCENCTFHVKAETHILQLDLSKNLEVYYAKGVFDIGRHKVLHAGVEDSKLHLLHDEGVHTEEICFVKLKAHEHDAEKPKEVQYVSHVVDGKLLTERVFRSKGQLPLTQAELDRAEAEGNGEGWQTREREAELKKIAGNEAFADANFVQACVFYTEGIDLAPKDSEQLPILWSNLAFARLKIGHLPEALEAAEEVLKLDPKNTKALFRKGLALHALKRFKEAAITLSEALELDPKNPRIKEALGFAELRARQQQQ